MKTIENTNRISTESLKVIEHKSVLLRRHIMEMIYSAKAGHTGGSLSCVDILNVLYNQIMDITPENFSDLHRDHYIHSKGHSVEALYAVLAEKGFFKIEELKKLEKFGSDFIGHPTRKVPGIEHNTGALGHGLSVAVGIALAIKKNNRNDRVFTIMGDGEITEGSIWEASACAAHYQLDNLVAIIDQNTLQITGRTKDVMSMEPLENKFLSFGFFVKWVDGHSIADLVEIFNKIPFEVGKPNLIIARTVKGKGISFIEDQVQWHHHVPDEKEYALVLQELKMAEKALEM